MSKYNFYLELKKEESDLLDTLSALRILIKKYESENHVSEVNPVKEPVQGIETKSNDSLEKPETTNGFDPSASIPKKLLYSLKLIKKGTSKDVAIKTFELDSSQTLEKWLDDSRFYMSKFYRENKLMVIKDDTVRGHVYALPLT